MPDEITDPKSQTSEGDDVKTVDDGEGTGTPTDKPEVTPGKVSFTKEQQDAVNRLMADTKRQTAERIKRDADEAAAIAAGKHEQLATQYKTERDNFESQVETLTAERDKYRDAVSARVKTRLKALPESIRDLAPRTEDPLLLDEWLAIAEKSAGGQTPRPGNGEDPRPKGAPVLSEKEIEAHMRDNPRYRRF